MRRGEIYGVDLGEAYGHRQAGRRPVIVLQSEDASRQLPTVLMVPLTTNLDTLRFPGTVLVEPDERNGLKRTSVALVFQLTAVDARFIDEQVGTLSQERLTEILQALDALIKQD